MTNLPREQDALHENAVRAAKASYDQRLESIARSAQTPVLFKAAPGTGKTTLLAYRIKHLVVEQRIMPEQIAAVTFTNAAVAEISAQLRKPTVGYLPNPIPENISTLHSFGARILKMYSTQVGRLNVPENFDIADEVDSEIILTDTTEDNRSLVGRAREIRSKVELGKMIREAKSGYRLWTDLQEGDLQTLYRHYQTLLHGHGAVDYDDLVLISARLLQQDDDVANDFKTRIPYLLIDECQDLTTTEARLVEAACALRTSPFAVGDERQDIRPLSSPEFIAGFGGGVDSGSLNICKRCREPILRAAQAVISSEQELSDLPAVLSYEHGGRTCRFTGEKVQVIETNGHQQEASTICDIIGELSASASLSHGDFAILCNQPRHLSFIASTLRERGISVRSGPKSQSRNRVLGDFLAHLQVIIDPESTLALGRCFDYLECQDRISKLPSLPICMRHWCAGV